MNSYKSRVNFWINFGSIVHFASTAGRDVSVRSCENVGSAHQWAALCWNFAHEHLADAGNAHALKVRVNQTGNTGSDHASAQTSTDRALNDLRGKNTQASVMRFFTCSEAVGSTIGTTFFCTTLAAIAPAPREAAPIRVSLLISIV